MRKSVSIPSFPVSMHTGWANFSAGGALCHRIMWSDTRRSTGNEPLITASLRFDYKELTGRVIIVTAHRDRSWCLRPISSDSIF